MSERELHENDSRYIEHCYGCIEDWMGELRTLPDGTGMRPEHYLLAIAHTAGLLARVYLGEPSPWHDNVPEGFLAVMAALHPRAGAGDEGTQP